MGGSLNVPATIKQYKKKKKKKNTLTTIYDIIVVKQASLQGPHICRWLYLV